VVLLGTSIVTGRNHSVKPGCRKAIVCRSRMARFNPGRVTLLAGRASLTGAAGERRWGAARPGRAGAVARHRGRRTRRKEGNSYGIPLELLWKSYGSPMDHLHRATVAPPSHHAPDKLTANEHAQVGDTALTLDSAVEPHARPQRISQYPPKTAPARHTAGRAEKPRLPHHPRRRRSSIGGIRPAP